MPGFDGTGPNGEGPMTGRGDGVRKFRRKLTPDITNDVVDNDQPVDNNAPTFYRLGRRYGRRGQRGRWNRD